MSPVPAASSVVADGPASGLPVVTGYRPDDFEVRLTSALAPGTAIGASRDLLAWHGSIAYATAVRSVTDVDVLVTLARSQRWPSSDLSHAARALARATVDAAHAALWATPIEGSPAYRAFAGLLTAGVAAEPPPQSLSGPLPAQPARQVAEPGEPHYARLARELREMTQLPTATLAAAMGVTREQYSRWVSGRPISAIRHGQLQYLHTIIRDLVRRFGADRSVVWLHTPLGQDGTPVDLLQRRRLDLIHRAVAALPDAEPVRDGKIVALIAPMEDLDEGDAEADGDQDGAWSPYASQSQAAEDGGPLAGR